MRINDLIEISRIQGQLKALLSQLKELEEHRRNIKPGVWRPNVDIVENDDSVLVLIELPGVMVEDVSAEILDRILLVRGCKRAPVAPEQKGSFLCLERRFGQFECQVALDLDVDVSEADARLENGELRIMFSKAKEEKRNVIRLLING